MTELLCVRGELVLELAPGTILRALISAHAERSPSAVTSVCMPTPASEGPAWARLREAIATVLAGLDCKLGEIALGHLAYPGSPVADHVAITQAKFGELTPLAEIGELSGGWFRGGRVIVINADHPSVAWLLELGGREPELAAYLALKLFFLRNKLDPKLDSQLASLAAEARWRRSIS